ncbi:OprD family outer membrane porin [Nitrosophilus kaiyonis]|uniref:OprD family outer membrane porin n=1 Tax=Nitrosophilus kaiyonis TaxID=2930200 RepID=UPI00248FA994|nr:OprD family outer membrane porin [Nitrosophilus kaiyonis]
MKKIGISLSVVALLGSATFAADDLTSAFKDAKYSGEIRAMYIKNSVKEGDDTRGFALGGNLGFESAPLYGISVGARFYTTQDMGLNDDNPNKVDQTLFGNSTDGYSILGQAYIKATFKNTTLVLGRQQLDTPLAGSDDIRIIPNLFEAYTLINKDLPDTTLILSHVTKMSGWDSLDNAKKFKPMSDAAGVGEIAPDEAVTVGAIIYEGFKNITLQAWDYYAHEVLNAVYLQADFNWKCLLSEDIDMSAALQYYSEKDKGKVNDAGVTIDYYVYGAMINAAHKSGLGLTLAFNKVSDDDSVHTFGAWGGYPEFAVADETWYNSLGNMQDAKSYKVALSYDFSSSNIEGLSATLAYVNFDLEDKYNANVDEDTDVFDVIIGYEGIKNLTLGAVYENRDSDDKALDNKVFKISASYSF